MKKFSILYLGEQFDAYGDLKIGTRCGTNQSGEESDFFTVNQVKNLMSHLQRALDEHGDKT